jgi:hypothetical protein
MPVFWRAWLKINRKAIVSTAGLEKPEIACSGVKYPNKNKIESKIMAVTSIENISVTNRINPIASKPITIAISGVIEANLGIVVK